MEPVASNDTSEGRQLNRRVELSSNGADIGRTCRRLTNFATIEEISLFAEVRICRSGFARSPLVLANTFRDPLD